MKAGQAALTIVVFARLLWAVPGVASLSPEQKCQAAKFKAAGKEIAGKMACYMKAKASSVPVLGDCLSKAKAKADTALNRAGDACAGLAAGVESDADTCVASLVAVTPGDGACPSASAKGEGKAAAALLGCQSKEVGKPGSFTACDTRNDSKISAVLSKAGGCVDVARVQSIIHDCNDRVTYGILPTCGNAVAPMCDGTCPSGQICFKSGAACGCLESLGIRCGSFNNVPACTGECPVQLPYCVVVGGACRCAASPG